MFISLIRRKYFTILPRVQRVKGRKKRKIWSVSGSSGDLSHLGRGRGPGGLNHDVHDII